MKGIAGYAKPDGSGGVTIDVESMIVDLCSVYKAGGLGLKDLINQVENIWPEVEVQIDIPKGRKS